MSSCHVAPLSCAIGDGWSDDEGSSASYDERDGARSGGRSRDRNGGSDSDSDSDSDDEGGGGGGSGSRCDVQRLVGAIGDWENHTRGMGSAMMLRMG